MAWLDWKRSITISCVRGRKTVCMVLDESVVEHGESLIRDA